MGVAAWSAEPMLSLGKIAAGPNAARYYVDQVARDRGDYYAGEGEAPGTWTGSGARSLGLGGEVDHGRFAELLKGAGLRRPPKEGAVAGFDLTFRAPKSVSVLWAVASPDVADGFRAGHDAAVGEALRYLEREACRARRGATGVVQVRGGGFVAAAFVHRASRAGDPLLHTHVVVGNLTHGPDGRWTALDARHLYRHAKTAGYLYQAVLRRELTERLGIAWQPVQRGAADVQGVPRDVIERFSQRRAEIVQHMVEHGGRSAAAAQVAALETRRAKQGVPTDRLRELWRSRAAEHGLDRDRVLTLFGRVAPAARSLVAVDVEQLTAEASIFGRPELLQALAAAQPAGARIAELEGLADATLLDPAVVRLTEGQVQAGLSEQRFTTRDMLAAESSLIEAALARRNSRVGVTSMRTLEGTLGEHGSLSPEQRELVRALCRRGDGVAVVRAPAGTGKTFALDAARQAWQREGIEVLGCALSARAARDLYDQTAIATTTIAAVCHGFEEGRELPRRSVLIVDEAGMVGTRALAELAAAAGRARAKLVLVGDDRQLPEIEAGGAFRALAQRLDALELREVRRQREPWDGEALDELRCGQVERWARAYRNAGRITVARSAVEARTALVNDWARADGDKLMIAARRSDVRDLNDRARQLLRARGELAPDAIEIGGRGFAVRDQVIVTRNDPQLEVINGQRATISAIDADRETVALATGDREIALDAAYLRAGHLDHGYAITAHRAQGATVDRAFVLGSDELYREWGYTALSRHRDEARFYIARGDLGLDRDQAPARDPVVAGIARILGRSRAKELARDGLPELDDQALTQERAELRGRLAHDPPPRDQVEVLAERVRAKRERLEATRLRIERLQRARDDMPRWRRRERGELDRLLDSNQSQAGEAEHVCAQARGDHERTLGAQRTWIAEHGPDAERLVVIDEEQRRRAVDERDARSHPGVAVGMRVAHVVLDPRVYVILESAETPRWQRVA